MNVNVRKFGKDVEKTRTIEFVFSDETRDSYGTVFTAKGWDLDRFNKNGIALFNHNAYSSDPDMSIGSARAWVEGNKLLGSITFEEKELNELADTVFRKFLAGTYKGVSIRFNPLENGTWGVGEESLEGKNPTYYFGKRELIEISAVPIPSNKNALVRSHGSETEAEIKEGEGYFTSGQIRIAEEGEAGDNDMDTEDANDGKGISNESFIRVYADAVRALHNV